MKLSSNAGFTLTELVTVIVIAGILSAIVYNKIDITGFKTEGSTDEVKSAVRYAQKLAVAQRRNVYVDTSGNDVRLCYDSGCATQVPQPPGSAWFKITAATAPTLSNAFYFDTLGRPTLVSGSTVATSAITLSLSGGTRSITIEPQTGFVH